MNKMIPGKLLYTEGKYRIYKTRVIGGHTFLLTTYGMAVKDYKSFGAALDAIGRISG